MTSPSNEPQGKPEPSDDPFRTSRPTKPYQSGVGPGHHPGKKLGSGKMVRQVWVIGILMLLQASLLLVAALMLVAYAVLIHFTMQAPPAGPGPTPPELWIVVAAAGVMGCLALVAGCAQFVSGIALLKMRGRKLGIVSLIVGLLACCTFYCAPTAIGLTVYGLIVLLNPETKLAFSLRAQGHSKEAVLNMFY